MTIWESWTIDVYKRQELDGGDMIKPNDKNVLNIIAEETSYRLGDMEHR